jgi:hypothetical protein
MDFLYDFWIVYDCLVSILPEFSDASIHHSFLSRCGAILELQVLVAMALQLLDQIAQHLRWSSVQAAILATVSAPKLYRSGFCWSALNFDDIWIYLALFCDPCSVGYFSDRPQLRF